MKSSNPCDSGSDKTSAHSSRLLQFAVTALRNLLCCVALNARLFAATQNYFTDAEAGCIQTFLRDNFKETNACMVIGLVDERGGRIFSAGTLGNGTNATVNGDTVFELGSVTKTFTALLLLDMVERGEMKLDDPVAMYLPKRVTVPVHGKKKLHSLTWPRRTLDCLSMLTIWPPVIGWKRSTPTPLPIFMRFYRDTL